MQPIIFAALFLLIVSCSQKKETHIATSADSVSFTIFDAPQGGYGYDILINGKVKIHQPTIPAIPGNNGFDSKENAQRVAEVIISKIKSSQMPPSISHAELKALNVILPNAE